MRKYIASNVQDVLKKAPNLIFTVAENKKYVEQSRNFIIF